MIAQLYCITLLQLHSCIDFSWLLLPAGELAAALAVCEELDVLLPVSLLSRTAVLVPLGFAPAAAAAIHTALKLAMELPAEPPLPTELGRWKTHQLL